MRILTRLELVLTRLENSKEFLFLVFTSFIFFLLRLPSLFEPYWYGDEGIYQVIGLALNQDRLLYRDIWDNKPPFLYLIYAIFSSDQFTIRLVSLITGIISIAVFCILSKNLFHINGKATKITYLTTAFFSLLLAIPLIEGNIANAENFMFLPILLAGLLIFNSANRSSNSQFSINSQLVLSGCLLSIAFLTKVVALFDLGAFLTFLFIVNYQGKRNLYSELRRLLPIIVSFLIPILLVSLFFFAKGAFEDFFNAALRQNIGYVGYGNQLIIKQGLLFIKLFLLFSSILFLFFKRKIFSKSEIFILVWLLFSLFNSFFSQRPYTHYLLVLLPSFSLLLGLGLNKRYGKIYLGIFIFLIFFLMKNFWIYNKVFPYYKNFISFIAKDISVSQYRSFFDKQTAVDYQLLQYLKSRTKNNEGVFIWGNNGQVYKLLDKLPPGRYIVKYHITSTADSLKETTQAFKKKNPKYIINTSSSDNIPFNISSYTQKFKIGSSVIYERIY